MARKKTKIPTNVTRQELWSIAQRMTQMAALYEIDPYFLNESDQLRKVIHFWRTSTKLQQELPPELPGFILGAHSAITQVYKNVQRELISVSDAEKEVEEICAVFLKPVAGKHKIKWPKFIKPTEAAFEELTGPSQLAAENLGMIFEGFGWRTIYKLARQQEEFAKSRLAKASVNVEDVLVISRVLDVPMAIARKIVKQISNIHRGTNHNSRLPSDEVWTSKGWKAL